MNAEAWLPVPGWEDRYEVSDHGRVRSNRGVVLRLQLNKYGYPVVRMGRGRKEGWCPTVHKLVMLAFVGPRPADRPVIRHLDGVKTNSRLSNLAYGTYSENELDKRRLGELPARATHCHAGHVFDDVNAYLRTDGSRGCRPCHKEAQARYVARRAAVA